MKKEQEKVQERKPTLQEKRLKELHKLLTKNNSVEDLDEYLKLYMSMILNHVLSLKINFNKDN
tara:strand:+ start:361 stop:549 length:189 start_codon:yes stop_codon:yes gene_type:complete